MKSPTERALAKFTAAWKKSRRGTQWRQRDDAWATGKYGALYRVMYLPQGQRYDIGVESGALYERLSAELAKRHFVPMPESTWPKGKKNAPKCCPGRTHPGGWFLHTDTGAVFAITLPTSGRKRVRIWSSLEGQLDPTEVLALLAGGCS